MSSRSDERPDNIAFELSADQAGADPYDFWRESVFYGFEAAARKRTPTPFAAKAAGIVSPRGEFIVSTSRSIAGRRRRSDIDTDGNRHLTLGLMLSGTRRFSADGQSLVSNAGDMYFYNAAMPSQISVTDHRMAYVAVRPDDSHPGLDKSKFDASEMQRRLATSSLRPFFLMQMQMMLDQSKVPRRDGRMLDIMLDLTHLVLHQARGGPVVNLGALRRGLASAAHHAIVSNLANPKLDAGFLAARLNCTRATLYRAFADQGIAIASHIRALRLIKVRHLLEHAKPDEDMGSLLIKCGIHDEVHFARLFRRYFGVRPSDIKGTIMSEDKDASSLPLAQLAIVN